MIHENDIVVFLSHAVDRAVSGGLRVWSYLEQTEKVLDDLEVHVVIVNNEHSGVGIDSTGRCFVRFFALNVHGSLIHRSIVYYLLCKVEIEI